MPRLGSCRTISTNGSEVTTRNGRIKAAGVSASRRCKHSLTPSPLRGKKRSLPDHHQQRTGHLQKGTVCKIKYKLLQPTLAAGDLVLMDNLGSHKGKAIRRAIRAAGAKLFFLPKYSPDLNPIEQVFAKLKHLLRKAAARTVEAVIAAIGQLLGTYTAQECANYFTNAGYGQT